MAERTLTVTVIDVNGDPEVGQVVRLEIEGTGNTALFLR